MRSASTLVAAAAAAACACTIFTTRDAHALGPVDLEIGAKAGLGGNPLDLPSGSPSINPLGFGLGGRAGVALLGFYGGVNFMHYFGGSEGPLTLTTNMYGLEAGYGITLLDLLTIRPQIGVGSANISASSPYFNGSDSNSNLYIEPGVTAFVSTGMWYVGADANLLDLPGFGWGPIGSKLTYTMHAQLGVKL